MDNIKTSYVNKLYNNYKINSVKLKNQSLNIINKFGFTHNENSIQQSTNYKFNSCINVLDNKDNNSMINKNSENKNLYTDLNQLEKTNKAFFDKQIIMSKTLSKIINNYKILPENGNYYKAQKNTNENNSFNSINLNKITEIENGLINNKKRQLSFLNLHNKSSLANQSLTNINNELNSENYNNQISELLIQKEH